MSNHSTKRDGTHKEINEALQFDGWLTFDTHMVGKDFPDIIAAKPGINLLVECKSKGGKLSPGQELWHLSWPGPKIVAFSGPDAVEKAREINQTKGTK